MAGGLVAVFLVVACSALFADTGAAQADPCGCMHALVPMKPATAGAPAALEGSAAPARSAEAPLRELALALVARQRDDPRVERASTRPIALRAPPVA